jgi:hypothetical protein
MTSIREKSTQSNWGSLLTFSILEQLYPRETIACLLAQDHAQERRTRKLSHLVMVYLLIAWSLLARHALRSVCDRFLRAWRLSSDEALPSTPTAAAFCYRRRLLGVRVLRHLFQQCCRPFATTQTPGAFAFGLRLMGIDGTQIAVADTPENRAGLGNQSTTFPRLQALLLVEIGTHAIVDAIPATCQVGESRLVKGLLRSIEAGMLVLWDRGFFCFRHLAAFTQRGAHVLGRLSSLDLAARHGQCLSDGSVLLTLTRKDDPSLIKPLTVRVISYRLQPQVADALQQVTPSHSQHGSGSTNPKVQEVHRLVTTLLDPQQYPALDLCVLYHERWEVELVIDEIKEHQRIAQRPLVSKHLCGLWQEVYALLLAHYALRWVMGQAATQAEIDPDRLSFTHSIALLTDALFLAPVLSAQQQQHLGRRLARELTQADWLLPPRRLRFNSRVIKHPRARFQFKLPRHVFLTPKDFSALLTLPAPSFRDLLLI